MATAPKKPVISAPVLAAVESAPPAPHALAMEPAPAPAPAPAIAPPAPAAAEAHPFAAASKMFEAPALNEVQAKVRTMFEKGLSETRSSYAKAKTAADETASAFEASLASAKSGVQELNTKALDAFRASAEANFDFAKSILGVKSMADFVALHGEFARKQIETTTAQMKTMAELSQKVATASVEPIKAQVAKTFKIAV